jgi:hypothetical protein
MKYRCVKRATGWVVQQKNTDAFLSATKSGWHPVRFSRHRHKFTALLHMLILRTINQK